MSMNIIFATGNEGKMREIREIMKDTDAVLFSAKEKSISTDVDETGTTFEENAVIKAKDAYEKGLAAGITDAVFLSDDSGLEVDYLNKEPGVYSARYMGEDTSYDIKNDSIIERLSGVPDDKRTARFVSVIAAVLPGGESFYVRGELEGRIGYERKGRYGFGYDPIFYYPPLDCHTGELLPEEKNAISHRGKALALMKEELVRRGILGGNRRA